MCHDITDGTVLWISPQLPRLARRSLPTSPCLSPPRPGLHLPPLPAIPCVFHVGLLCLLDCALKSISPCLCLCPSSTQNAWPLYSSRPGSTVTLFVGFPRQSHSLLFLRPQCLCHIPHLDSSRQWCIFASISPISWDVIRLWIPKA